MVLAVNAADIANAHELARENDINIRAWRFNERRDWLVREAFKHEIGKEVPQRAEKKLRPYQCKQKDNPEKELKSSVQDKKEWMSKAFKKDGGEGQLQKGIR